MALFEVLLCSDYPTQLSVGATFVVFGFHPQQADGRLNISYVVALSFVDTFLPATSAGDGFTAFGRLGL